jgi:hypothetical protein
VSLVDRIDPAPPRAVFRWDLDKTYLRTDFDTFRQLVKTALEKATDKVNVPGTAALMRELKNEHTRIFIVSGSPRQMRRVIEDKLRLDGVHWDELVLKDNVGNLLRGRFRAMRNQVGYKLPVLLESRIRLGLDVPETLFGDDAEADAFVYSLYADILSGRVSRELMGEVLDAARLYKDESALLFKLFDEVTGLREKAGGLVKLEPVRRIFIHLDRLTPPTRFSAYGPRLVPIYNYFQSALVLMADGAIGSVGVLKVALEMVQGYGYNLISLSNSFQDLIRRGIPVSQVAGALAEALTSQNPILAALLPAPDILAAFAGRVASLGAPPAPPAAVEVDYRRLLDDARPRTDKKRRLANE